MITREQVADLREGDVVEFVRDRFPDVVMRGPLREDGGTLWLGLMPVRREDGRRAVAVEDCTLTVVSRAPRPLYVNHPRTTPVLGDVAIPVDHDKDDLFTWSCVEWLNGFDLGRKWRSTRDDCWFDAAEFEGFRLRLLIDGETGQVVP